MGSTCPARTTTASTRRTRSCGTRPCCSGSSRGQSKDEDVVLAPLRLWTSPLGLKNGEDVRDAGSRILVGAHTLSSLSCFSGLLLTVARLKVLATTCRLRRVSQRDFRVHKKRK